MPRSRSRSRSRSSSPKRSGDHSHSHHDGHGHRHHHSHHRDDERKKDRAPKMMESGLRAGLTSHASLKEQNAAIHEQKRMKEQPREGEGDGSEQEVVYRDRHGRRLENLEEYLRKQEGALAKQQQQQYEWGAGIKQRQEREERQARLEEEKSRPLAQYADDEDIDAAVRQRVRWGDPAAAFNSRKSSSQDAASASAATGEARPRYKGPPAPPNRYGIEPDYLWDGVDRSNGFEKKLFAMQASKSAKDERKYFWSVADL